MTKTEKKKFEAARKAALNTYAEARSVRDGVSSSFYGMGGGPAAKLRELFKPSFDALESQFKTDMSLAQTLPLERTDWGKVANKAAEYRAFYVGLDEKMQAYVKLVGSGSDVPPATLPVPPMPAGDQSLAPGVALTPAVVPSEEGEGIGATTVLIGLAAVAAVVLVVRYVRGRGGLSGWSRMNPSLDWDATAERAERMSVSSLHHAIADIKKTIPSSRKLDREDNGDREGWYMDEMSVYRKELKKRGL